MQKNCIGLHQKKLTMITNTNNTAGTKSKWQDVIFSRPQ